MKEKPVLVRACLCGATFSTRRVSRRLCRGCKAAERAEGEGDRLRGLPLTWEKVRRLREASTYACPALTVAQLAERFGLPALVVRAVLSGSDWRKWQAEDDATKAWLDPFADLEGVATPRRRGYHWDERGDDEVIGDGPDVVKERPMLYLLPGRELVTR